MLWTVLAATIATLFAFDLWLAPRIWPRAGPRRAAIESALWIAAGLAFAGVVWSVRGGQALDYLTAYAVEKSLSVDNLLVFALTFEFFAIPRDRQRRVLFLGVLGALVFRGVFIALGLSLLRTLAWIDLVFATLLVASGLRLGVAAWRGERRRPRENVAVRLAARWLPVDRDNRGPRFWVRSGSRVCLTLPFLALVAIESADIVFAIDSVPAVLAITRDPLIAYSSNAFAVLGLRALYLLLADVLERAPLLRPALAVLLVLVGAKLVADRFVAIPPWLPLVVIGVVLAGAIVGSRWWPAGGHGARAPERP
ncbi:MAG: TerC family protein [Vicinamibacterales bacterium]